MWNNPISLFCLIHNQSTRYLSCILHVSLPTICVTISEGRGGRKLSALKKALKNFLPAGKRFVKLLQYHINMNTSLFLQTGEIYFLDHLYQACIRSCHFKVCCHIVNIASDCTLQLSLHWSVLNNFRYRPTTCKLNRRVQSPTTMATGNYQQLPVGIKTDGPYTDSTKMPQKIFIRLEKIQKH